MPHFSISTLTAERPPAYIYITFSMSTMSNGNIIGAPDIKVQDQALAKTSRASPRSRADGVMIVRAPM
jgi:hypothetical protein